tara:strand:+ start:390 stop:557 length:168 start_codon:yes stop_codon:yes gene_type:complete
LQVVVADLLVLQKAVEHLILILHLQRGLTDQVAVEDHVIMLQTRDQQVVMVEFTL